MIFASQLASLRFQELFLKVNVNSRLKPLLRAHIFALLGTLKDFVVVEEPKPALLAQMIRATPSYDRLSILQVILSATLLAYLIYFFN